MRSKPTQDIPSVFDAAFDKHRTRLYRYLRRRLANEDDARELAQETFLRLLRVARTDLLADPQAYLYRVARNLVYEQTAKALPAERWVDESELQALVDPRGPPELEAERTALSERVENIIAELPPRNRAIVMLFCHEGLSQSEIAARVGLSKSMVQKCLAQGMTHCRKRLRALHGTSQGEEVLR